MGMDWTALWIGSLILLGVGLLWRISREYPPPHVRFSRVEVYKSYPKKGLRKWVGYAEWMEKGAFFCLFLAFLDFHFLFLKPLKNEHKGNPDPLEGIAIYLELDQSSSMNDPIEISLPGQAVKQMPKYEWVKEVTTRFVEDRPDDLVGLIAFARVANVWAPLTLDHTEILKKLSEYHPVQNQEQNGTAIGYAIYKAANLIAGTRYFAERYQGQGKAAYEVKNTIIVLVTDGIQEVNPLDKGKPWRSMDIPDAADYAKSVGVRLYILNINPEFSTEAFAPHRQQMEHAAEKTGGHLFLASGGMALPEVYQEINRLEKTKIFSSQQYLNALQNHLSKDKLPQFYQRISLYPYLIGFGLMLLLGSIIFQTIILRRVP